MKNITIYNYNKYRVQIKNFNNAINYYSPYIFNINGSFENMIIS